MKRIMIALFIVLSLALAPVMAADNETTFGVRYDRTSTTDTGTGTWEVLAGVTEHQQIGFAFGLNFLRADGERTTYYQFGPAYEFQVGHFIVGGVAQGQVLQLLPSLRGRSRLDGPDWRATVRTGVEFGDKAFVKLFVDHTWAWTGGGSEGSYGATAQIGIKF